MMDEKKFIKELLEILNVTTDDYPSTETMLITLKRAKELRAIEEFYNQHDSVHVKFKEITIEMKKRRDELIGERIAKEILEKQKKVLTKNK